MPPPIRAPSADLSDASGALLEEAVDRGVFVFLAQAGAIRHVGCANVGSAVSRALDDGERMVTCEALRFVPRGESIDTQGGRGSAVQVTVLEGVNLFGREGGRSRGVDRTGRQAVGMQVDEAGRDDGVAQVLSTVRGSFSRSDGYDGTVIDHDVPRFVDGAAVAGYDGARQGTRHAVADPTRPHP